MSKKYFVVSSLVFSLVFAGVSGIASANTLAKDTKKKEEKKPAVTLTSFSVIQKSVEKKKDENKRKEQKLTANDLTSNNAFLVAETKKKDDKKKSPEGAMEFVVSQSNSAFDSLAYQPTQWKPTSYMGSARHCSRRSRTSRGYVPMMIG